MKVVVLTGAGISAESGLPTFRGAGGLWRGLDPLALATPEAFAADPETVWAFYSDRRRMLLDASVQPNAAHRALVDLEKALGEDFLLITQNVDDLHQRAGSRRVRPLHGELLRSRCGGCGSEFVDREGFGRERTCPDCGRAGALRPAVVWFGEMPRHVEEAAEAVARCSHFVAVGTSGVVYPAAGLISYAPAGAELIEINPEPSGQPAFTRVVPSGATTGVPAICEELIAAAGRS